MKEVRGQHYSMGSTIGGIMIRRDERMKAEISRRALRDLVWASVIAVVFLVIHHGIV